MLLLSCSAMPDSVTSWTVAGQDFLSMWFSSQKYWSGLPFLPPSVFPNPGTESISSEVPSLSGRFFYHWATSEAFIYKYLFSYSELPMWHSGKESTCNAGNGVWFLGWEDPLEEEMATHSSILWTEESGRLQSMGLQTVGHWATEHTRSVYLTNDFKSPVCSF